MSSPNQHHRPLVGGIKITSGVGQNPIERFGDGTLTGLATKSNGQKVLVTCLHAMTDVRAPDRRAEMYQNVIDAPPPHTILETTNRIGVNMTPGPALPEAATAYSADVAMCELDTDAEGNPVQAEFTVHGSPNKKIVHGTVAVAVGDAVSVFGQYDEYIGTVLAIRNVDVKYTVPNPDPNAEERTIKFTRRIANGLVLDMGAGMPRRGDSGAPCLVQAGNAYKMAAIFMAGPEDRVWIDITTSEIQEDYFPPVGGEPNIVQKRVGYAFPASAAQTALGITFGKPLPTANAVGPETVTCCANTTVDLDGSGSSDPEGDTLTCRWEQVDAEGAPLAEDAAERVTLERATTEEPRFRAPQVTETTDLRFKLTVTDTFGQTDSATVQVTAEPEVWEAWAYTGQVQVNADDETEYEQQRTSDCDNTQVRWVPELPPTDWTRTGRTRGCGADREAEEIRANSAGDIETQWVSAAETVTWGSWTATGAMRGCGADREAEESRTSNCNDTETRWVSDPGTVTWGSWSRTGSTRGCGSDREAEESRTNNCNDTQTRWVSDPGTVTWGSWSRTGSTRGCGADREAEESRTSNCNDTETRWVSAAVAETWGSWSRTGNTRFNGILREAEESRTSNCGNTQTRWVSDPETETWGSWSRTGSTRGCGPDKEAAESRTSSYGNTQTRWVSTPVAETWGSWTSTGNQRYNGIELEYEHERTSNCGNTQTQWLPA